MLVVKAESIKLPEGVKLSKEGMDVFNSFKAYSFLNQHEGGEPLSDLCLVPYDNDAPIEDILEEGMYDFVSENPYFKNFEKLVDELETGARFLSFTVDDILYTM